MSHAGGLKTIETVFTNIKKKSNHCKGASVQALLWPWSSERESCSERNTHYLFLKKDDLLITNLRFVKHCSSLQDNLIW